MVKQIFVNLPVKNLKRTMDFFGKLGFRFDRTFTDKNAACLVLGKNLYAMLLVEKFFKGFITKKKIADARKATEAITALQVASRREVDELVKKARKAGARLLNKPYDYGWMYGQAIEDLDGHQWEFFFMDVAKMKKAQKQEKKK